MAKALPAVAEGCCGVSGDKWRPSFFHGPGECEDRRGEGRGVTSPIADITGLATVELAAEAELKAPEMLPVLRLGVLDSGCREEVEVL